MTHELDTLSSLAKKTLDEHGNDPCNLNLDCLGSNPNMSYCAFENTSSAVQQLTDGIETAMEAVGIHGGDGWTAIQNDLILHALDLTSRAEKEAWMRLAEQASALADLLNSVKPFFAFPRLTPCEAIAVRKIEARAELDAAGTPQGEPEGTTMPEAAKFVDLDVVAECYDGVGVEMSRALWARVTDEAHEVSAEAAQHGFDLQKEGSSDNSVAANWETFNDAEKAELVAIFAAREAS